ncbi:MAG: aspartate/tyrosine/aromatic aminotransferase [Ideonella sp.]|nr:aspartate/tyrosine/aromatic aminotransferase [Ideonella sp.]MCC7459276.1 aspartate/tyrosine/aromatic aminotransferase [Nitrospira sp.]
MTLFSNVELAARDPILGLNEQFAADPNPRKVNLGVGMYYDDKGRLPLLQCVATAEQAMAEAHAARGYLPIDGIAAYDQAAQRLAFGDASPAVTERRIATVQALGGTGALKVAADFLKRLRPDAGVLISDPSWENHRALFTQAGFAVATYPYYDAESRGVRFAAVLAALNAAAPGTVVVLHACCHNPTGYDLDAGQWSQVIASARARGWIPVLDMAYQGFGEGLDADAAAVRRFVEAGIDCFVATSFSKSFSLYGERVGALSVVCSDAEQAQRVLSQLKVLIRTNYSNPPTHGAKAVSAVLADAKLRSQWEAELAQMRERIQRMRVALIERLQAAGVERDMSFIARQRGMFSYSGLSAAQMGRLRSEFGVYGVDSGRICVAALNDGNIEYVARAIAAVM